MLKFQIVSVISLKKLFYLQRLKLDLTGDLVKHKLICFCFITLSGCREHSSRVHSSRAHSSRVHSSRVYSSRVYSSGVYSSCVYSYRVYSSRVYFIPGISLPYDLFIPTNWS